MTDKVPSDVQAYIVTYDIAEGSLATESRDTLRRCGTKLSMSAYLIPADKLPTNLIERMRQMVGFTVRRLSVTEMRMDRDTLKEMAQEEIDEYVRARHGKLIKDLGTASDAIDAALSELTTAEARDKAIKGYKTLAQRKLREAQVVIGQALDAAEAFDLTENFLDLTNALAKVTKANRLAVESRLAALKS